MKRIGIIVTDPASYPPQDTDNDTAPLCAALRELGADAQALVWHDAAVDWASFDLLVIRSPWDYVDKAGEFAAWLDRVEASGTPLVNAPGLIRWNMDKHYLAELAERGIGVVPTRYVGDAADLAGALAAAGAGGEAAETAGESGVGTADASGRVVVKPTVGAGSSRTGLFTADDPAAADLARGILAGGGTVMVQPEVPELSRGGEKALYVVGGRLTHAIAKGALLAPGGGFLGGVYREHPVPVDTTAAEEAFAARVLDAVTAVTGHAPLYGRIDLVDTAAYGTVLLEAELFEPALHLDVVPHVATPFAAAVLGRAVHGRSTHGGDTGTADVAGQVSGASPTV